MGNDFYTVFTRSNLVFLFWFLAIYMLLSFCISVFQGNKDDDPSKKFRQKRLAARFFDIIVFLITGLVLINKILYNNVTLFQSDDLQYLDDPMTLVAGILHLLIFYFFIYVLGVSMEPATKSIAITIYEFLSWALVLIVSVVLFFKYILNIYLTGELQSLWDSIPDPLAGISGITGNVLISGNVDVGGNISANVSSSILSMKGNIAPPISGNVVLPRPQKEVFNISNNLYSYEDAASICSAYGAQLATYDDIERSYNDGGEWCNYGWSDGQMILFPTQKDTWQKLQRNPKTKNNCGRPGINGGYIDNPYMKFGVNCYGVKPTPKQRDLDRMNARNGQLNPKSPADAVLDEKVAFWMKNADKMLNINSFNTKKWSEY